MSSDQQLRPSNEVDDRHLELARRAGDAHLEAAEPMIEEVAETGDKTQSGDYIVGFAHEEAEGLYRLEDGGLQWSEPSPAANCHLEVIVASAADRRFLPELAVCATLGDGEGNAVGTEAIPFVPHLAVYHDGKNLELAGDGRYTITVEVDPAGFPRHDEENGDRFSEPVEGRFEDVHIQPGRG